MSKVLSDKRIRKNMKLAILNILIQVETAEKRRQEAETEAKQLEFTKNELEVKR